MSVEGEREGERGREGEREGRERGRERERVSERATGNLYTICIDKLNKLKTIIVNR